MEKEPFKFKIEKAFERASKKEKSFTLFQDEFGSEVLTLQIFQYSLYGKMLIYGEKELIVTQAVHECVFSIEKNESEVERIKNIIFNDTIEFIDKMMVEMKFMNELGFNILGYGRYGLDDVMLRHDAKYGIMMEDGNWRKQVLKNAYYQVDDMRIALKVFGDEPDHFMKLPCAARDWVLNQPVLKEYAFS